MYTQNITVRNLRQYIDKILLCFLEGVSGPRSAGRIRFLDLGAECMGVLIFFSFVCKELSKFHEVK